MVDEGDEAEVQKPVVDTYDTLVEKRKNLESSIETTEKQIKDAVEALNEAKKIQQSDNDDLDAYMATLSKTDKGHGGKENVSRLRQLLQTQQIEVNLLVHYKSILISKRPKSEKKIKTHDFSSPAGTSFKNGFHQIKSKNYGCQLTVF